MTGTASVDPMTPYRNPIWLEAKKPSRQPSKSASATSSINSMRIRRTIDLFSLGAFSFSFSHARQPPHQILQLLRSPVQPNQEEPFNDRRFGSG